MVVCITFVPFLAKDSPFRPRLRATQQCKPGVDGAWSAQTGFRRKLDFKDLIEDSAGLAAANAGRECSRFRVARRPRSHFGVSGAHAKPGGKLHDLTRTSLEHAKGGQLLEVPPCPSD